MGTYALLLLFAVLGGLLVHAAVYHFDPAVTPDSATYVAAAKSLAAGAGYLDYDGSPYVEKPPLYPTILAAGRLVGLDPMETVGVLHPIVFGLIIFCTGLLLFVRLRGGVFVWTGCAAVLFSWPLLQVAVKVWSELVFILLTILFLAYAPGVLARPSWPRVLLFALLAAFAFLQRYAGAALVFAGVFLILFSARRISTHKRWQFIGGFLLVATGPIIPWLIRNYLATSTITGARTVSLHLLVKESVTQLVQTVNTWIIPPLLPVWSGYILGAVLFTVVVLNVAGRSRRERLSRYLQDRTMVVFVVTYTIFVVFTAALQASANPGNRILSPIYIPLVYLVVAALDRLTSNPFARRLGGGRLRKVVAGVSALWLVYPAASTGIYISARASYDTNVWHKSALAQLLNEKPPEGLLYSNEPWVAYLASSKHAKGEALIDFEACSKWERGGQEPPCHLAWFYGRNRGRDHVRSILQDFVANSAASLESTRAETLGNAVLGFMRRGGLAVRADDPSDPAGRTYPALPDSIRAQEIESCSDGALFLLTTESAPDE